MSGRRDASIVIPSESLSPKPVKNDRERASRELDAQVMTTVFGREIKWYRGDPFYLGSEDGGWKTESTVPRFSLSLVDAMKVADAMKGGYKLTRYAYATKRPFTATLYATRADTNGRSAEAETLPLAICLSALKALGIPGDANG